MSIIPVHALSSSDLKLLGNNLAPGVRRPSPRGRLERSQLAAINRSLAALGERAGPLRRPLLGACPRP